MQSKNYNAYRITHKDGSIEDINAVDLIQALENMDVQETESKVIQAFLVKENVRTLVADEPTEIIFSIVTEGGIVSSAPWCLSSYLTSRAKNSFASLLWFMMILAGEI